MARYTARFALQAPDTTPADQYRPEDFRGCPEALDAWLRGDWRGVGSEDEPAVELTGRAE